MLIAKRSIISLLSKQASISSASIASNVCRAFATSTSAKLKNKPEPNPTTESETVFDLRRHLKYEINTQKEVIEGIYGDLDSGIVLKNYETFLNDKKWTVDHAENSTLVTLKRRDEGLKGEVCIKFDLMEVFNEMNDSENLEEFNSHEEEDEVAERSEEESEETTSSEMEEIDEESEFLALPFAIEINKDSIPDKTLRFDCVLEGDEVENEILIENVSINPSDQTADTTNTYNSPVYTQFDTNIQQHFEDFVDELVYSEELMGFIKNYSIANESSMYQKWLNDVRSILKH